MRETETDFKLGDAYVTDHQHHEADALEEMYKHARCICDTIEHYINDDEITIKLDNLDEVYKAITAIKELAYYEYEGDRSDRWNREYTDTFEYNFKRQITAFLVDNLGYTWSEL
jgi:hypothetical protein